MAYACGDCYPQYHVDKVLKGTTKEKVLDTDLLLTFKDPVQEEVMDEQTSGCIICYDLYFSGELWKTRWKGMYLVVEHVYYKQRNKRCCESKGND